MDDIAHSSMVSKPEKAPNSVIRHGHLVSSFSDHTHRMLLDSICILYVTYRASWRTLTGRCHGSSGMPLLSSLDKMLDRGRSALLVFYIAALLSVCTIGLVGKFPSFRALLFALGIGSAAVSVVFLLRFLRAKDEREQQVNYRALTFAFTGTLIFSLTIGFLQSFGFHAVSWLGISALMIVLWSIGLIFHSWRYR